MNESPHQNGTDEEPQPTIAETLADSEIVAKTADRLGIPVAIEGEDESPPDHEPESETPPNDAPNETDVGNETTPPEDDGKATPPHGDKLVNEAT